MTVASGVWVAVDDAGAAGTSVVLCIPSGVRVTVTIGLMMRTGGSGVDALSEHADNTPIMMMTARNTSALCINKPPHCLLCAILNLPCVVKDMPCTSSYKVTGLPQ